MLNNEIAHIGTRRQPTRDARARQEIPSVSFSIHWIFPLGHSTRKGLSLEDNQCKTVAVTHTCVTQYASCWWYIATHLGLCSGISALCRNA